MPAFLTQADLERRVTAERVLRMADDDGDGSLNGTEQANVTAAMDEAESYALSTVSKAGYDMDSFALLANADPAIKQHVAWMAVEILSERRLEFTSSEGWGPYKAQFERAETYLKRFSQGRKRSPQGEAAAGKNKQVGGNRRPKRASGVADFVFAPSKNYPTGHGGF